MKKILKKKSQPIEISMSETMSDPSLDGDVLSFSEHLNSIISSRPSAASSESASRPRKTLTIRPEHKYTNVGVSGKRSDKKSNTSEGRNVKEPIKRHSKREIDKKSDISGEGRKSARDKKTDPAPIIHEDMSDYILIPKKQYGKLDLYDQVRYINKHGKLVSGGFIIKKEFDISRKKNVWHLSADRRQTGFSWRVYPDTINQMWKKKIYIPELTRLDYVVNFLSDHHGKQFTDGLPPI